MKTNPDHHPNLVSRQARTKKGESLFIFLGKEGLLISSSAHQIELAIHDDLVLLLNSASQDCRYRNVSQSPHHKQNGAGKPLWILVLMVIRRFPAGIPWRREKKLLSSRFFFVARDFSEGVTTSTFANQSKKPETGHCLFLPSCYPSG